MFFATARFGVAADDTLARTFETLAQAGLKGTAEGLVEAEAAYARAKRLAPDDGRVDYAWSIVLTRHRQFADAEQAFEKALAAKQVCLPAQVARVRGTLKSRKYTQVAEELIELAELVGNTADTQFTPDERRACAEWIGRVVAFLSGPLGDAELVALVRRRESGLRSYLGDWQADYDRGQRELGLTHRGLQDKLSLVIADAESQKVESLRTNQDKQAKLDDAYKSASSEGAKANDTAGERLADLKTQIGSLEKQFQNLLTTETRITESLFQMQMEMTRLGIDLERLNKYEGYPAAKTIYAMKIQETQIEMELLQTDLTMVWNEKQQLLGQAGTAAKARLATLSQQQQIEFQKTHDSEKYQRLQRSLQEDAKKVASSSSSKAGRAQGLRNKMQSWSTYDPSTPASELARLAGL